MSKFDPQRFGVLIIDEAHHATSPTYRRVIDYYRTNPALKVLGVTATPDRADEEALGQVFQSVAFDYEVLDAIHDGWLVPIEQQMVHVEGLDYSSIRTTAGDLNGGDLAAVLEAEKNLQQMASASVAIINQMEVGRTVPCAPLNGTPGAHGVTRPTSAASKRKLSVTPLETVDVSHKPSRVASPSSRWNTQRNRAPSAVGTTASPSPWYSAPAFAPICVHGMEVFPGTVSRASFAPAL